MNMRIPNNTTNTQKNTLIIFLLFLIFSRLSDDEGCLLDPLRLGVAAAKKMVIMRVANSMGAQYTPITLGPTGLIHTLATQTPRNNIIKKGIMLSHGPLLLNPMAKITLTKMDTMSTRIKVVIIIMLTIGLIST